ncbi:pentatricopeptide repeat-containing protein [Iris pallida]|uniref:Pentatricopeptide repeat-containing protein n=1 Tax=Iris pallida TaxID=29817 RepID=A0AAX6F5H2_IRIPA|nr:pentatricopeptide repeat-containing protein [Iris pallida]
MPPAPNPTAKPYFYYGHRRPSQNRPVVRGGLLTNRRSHPIPNKPTAAPTAATNFLQWDPHAPAPASPPPPSSVPASLRRLSPLARFLLDSLLRHRRWGPPLLSDLSKLRRITPHLLTELLRHQPPPHLPPDLLLRLFHHASRQKGFRHTFASYNALAYALHRSNLHRSADRVPDLMLSLGNLRPTEKQLEILVRFHSDAGRGLRLYHVYSRMRGSAFNIKPRIFLYNRILDGLVKTGHLDLALKVFDNMNADGVQLEPITFTILAKGFCKEGRVEEAIEILERMRGEVCRPDVFAYTAMVKVLTETGNFDGCLRVWDEMARDGVEADVMAYTTMVSGLCRDGRVDRAEQLFREMKGREGMVIDRGVYGSLVEGFVRGGKVEDGCRVLKEMVADGYRPDLGIYDCLIRGLCEDGRVDKAYKLFQVLVSEGLTPSLETVTPFLVAHVDAEDMDRFFKLVDRIEELHLPTMDHLDNFFRAFVGKGERELRGLEVFEALKGKGYHSVSIYNTLIDGLHKNNINNKALLLFDEMKGLKNLELGSSTYNLIIPCYVDSGDIREACACYNKMKELTWIPSVTAYCSLVKGLCKMGEIDAAITLVKDCLGNVTSGPMEFKYTLTVLNACRSRDPEKVVGVLDEMVEEGYLLEDIIYCAVIHGFCKHASSVEARKVLVVMKSRNLLTEADFIVYEEMLNEHLKKTTASLVISGLKFFGLESKLKLISSTY